MEKADFDLSQFITGSLCLQANTDSPTRKMYPLPFKDPYLDRLLADPLETVGEKGFQKRNEVPEEIVGTPIQEFFRGAHVFITGGTGYIGKLLVEKLIRSVPHLGHIYLLIRKKRGMTGDERFKKLFTDQIFLRMKTEVPHYRELITAMEGDMSEPHLGLSESDRQLLSEKVNVVFHSAADVRFIEPLRTAIQSNVYGSRKVLELAKGMKQLKSYVHVSTAYSQCVRRVIDETIPKMSISYKEILDYVESISDEELCKEQTRILQGWPNTYTFSKALCEDMVREEARDLPICIFRPSVVMPTYREPVRGYSDNLNGPMGMLLGIGMGVLHVMRIDPELTVDNVPADYVVNCMAAAAWQTRRRSEYGDPVVYNFTSTPTMHCVWKELINMGERYQQYWPFDKSIWSCSFIPTQSEFLDKWGHFFLHKIPGIILDQIAIMVGQKPRLSKSFRKIETVKKPLEYFTFNVFEFKNENVTELWRKMTPEDKSIFHFDISDVDSRWFFLFGKLGLRYFFLKEKMEDLPAAEIKYKRLRIIHNIVKAVFGLAALKLLACLAHALPI